MSEVDCVLLQIALTCIAAFLNVIFVSIPGPSTLDPVSTGPQLLLYTSMISLACDKTWEVITSMISGKRITLIEDITCKFNNKIIMFVIIINNYNNINDPFNNYSTWNPSLMDIP